MIRKINILLLTLSILFGIGCSEDFLETKPTDAISAKDALSSPENMMLVLNGLHRQMYAQNPLEGASWSRTGQSHFMPSLDAIGGNIIHSSPGNGWMRSDLQWRMHTDATFTTTTNLWFQRYHFIASANSIINKVEEDGLLVDELMNNILGQSHAYRAWAYLQLVSTYAKGYIISGDPANEPGVPLMLGRAEDKEEEAKGLPRASVAAVYSQMETDIDAAIGYLQNASSPKNKSHISINAAYGIKARIALSKGDWSTAASAAAMARDGYALMGYSDYISGFNTYDLSEVIWGGRVIDTETNYYASYFYYTSPTFNGSQNRSNPKIINSEMYDMIPETDYRNELWLPLAPNTNSSASNGQGGSYETDPNYDNEEDWIAARDAVRSKYGMTSRHNTHPYMTVKLLQKNPGTIDPDDVIYMRSSEMYLIEAEAKAMMDDIQGAQDAIEPLAKERDSAYDKTMYDTKEKMMEHIKWQRHIELWGEGHSYYDHIRWDDELDQSRSGAAEVLYQDGFYQEKPSINDKWIWKIPQAELDANDNISEADQN